MKIIDCIQGTQEWRDARCGIPTASGFDKIITTEGKQSKQRTKYLWQLAGERICGLAEESYQSAAMQRGSQMEDEARKFYEFTTGVNVQKVGFCASDCGRFGGSPDALVGDDGLIEIKCPSLGVHVGYLLEGKLPMDYYQQTQGQLFVTGRWWSDFVSYYPGIRPLVVRVFPDLMFHSCLKIELNGFCAELESIIKRIS